jgi:hypothetical protein
MKTISVQKEGNLVFRRKMGGQIIESRERIGKAREGTTNMQGQERMTKRAVSAIRKTGTAAAIEKCRKSSI